MDPGISSFLFLVSCFLTIKNFPGRQLEKINLFCSVDKLCPNQDILIFFFKKKFLP